VHQATEVNATNQTVHYKYNLKMQSSIINCHTTNTVYVVHQTTEVNATNPTKTFTTQLSSCPSWQFITKEKFNHPPINLQTTVWGWVVGPDYRV